MQVNHGGAVSKPWFLCRYTNEWSTLIVILSEATAKSKDLSLLFRQRDKDRYQCILLFPAPAVQLFLARDRSSNITEALEIRQINTMIVAVETGNLAGLMLGDAPSRLSVTPNPQRGARFLARHVNPVAVIYRPD